MAVLIDTDVLIDVERGGPVDHLDEAAGGEERGISVITVSELLHGVRRASGDIRVRRAAFVEHVLAGMSALPITEPVARVHADLWADLADRGQQIGAHDLWIAATAVAHGLGIVTRNTADFGRVPGLRVVAA
ncbi:PIN domain-containing protein [Svornostia abyssi]|uniref:Ribonuclease VapC n=1 Tax=Svornostia abyssi TaxID=2898438 RepID=A0ABY5PHZ6_9ACTN|nr:PIN domain-containing protein [Parviterribacteraceae bacterium J379]